MQPRFVLHHRQNPACIVRLGIGLHFLTRFANAPNLANVMRRSSDLHLSDESGLQGVVLVLFVDYSLYYILLPLFTTTRRGWTGSGGKRSTCRASGRGRDKLCAATAPREKEGLRKPLPRQR